MHTQNIIVVALLLITPKSAATSLSGYIVDSGLDFATNKLLNSFQRIAYDASSAQSLSDFTQELTISVLSLLNNAAPSMVSNVVEVETKIASNNEALPNADDETCTRDYTSMCPTNYIDIGDGMHCKALQSYAGNCDKLLDMSNKTPQQKRQIALNCGVQWSCQATCPQEFSFPCPSGWINLGDMLCKAPDSYIGRCVREKSFKDFDETMKEQWAAECGLQWPCRRRNFDFSSRMCPIDWVEIDNKNCVAPKHYIGPCDMTIPFGSMSKEEKLKLSFICKVEWPSKARANYEFSYSCPLGWQKLHDKSGYCKAPQSYQGPCKFIQAFEKFSAKEKYEWAEKCGAIWPFKENTKHNYEYSAFCPMGWKLLNKESGMCEAPAHYNGRCYSPFSFKNYSPEMKASWSYVCEAPFEPTLLVSEKKLQNIQNLSTELFRISESGHDGVVGLPASPLWGKILEANGTVYLSSGIQKQSEVFKKLNPKVAGFATTQYHIEKPKKKVYEKEPPANSVVEDAASQLIDKGQKQNKFSFMQIKDDEENNFDSKNDSLLPYVSEMQFTANPMTSSAVGNSEYECARNYNACPKGWQNLDNITCMAPDTYLANGGTCNTVVELGRMVDNRGFRNIEQIKRWSKECAVEFPCIEFPRDYVRVLCPEGWNNIGDGNCMAPRNYPDHLKERCGTIVNFKFAIPDFRQTWSKICAADWPLFARCEPDFSEPCPLGFEKVVSTMEFSSKPNICKAHDWRTDLQEEICRSPLIVPDEPIAKHNIAKKCGVQWGCNFECNMDFWQKCPYGWVYKTNKCYAPADYIPPPGCPVIFKVNGSIFGENKHKLYQHVTRCHTPWPCKGSCQSDWRHSCPLHWKESKSQDFQGQVTCKPPDNYDGPCGRNEQNLTGHTFAQKQEFAFRCRVKWPCGGMKSFGRIILKINKGWQTEEVYRDKNWEHLNSAETIFDPPILLGKRKLTQ